MITIQSPTIELYDNETNEFIYREGDTVRFEYSLKVIYEWEGKWKKPFFKSEMTEEESMDFYSLMALDPISYDFLTVDVIKKLSNYISDSSTATTFSSDLLNVGIKSKNGKISTSEEIYASMFSNNIPLDFENRNFNRLQTILRIISLANEPPKKMSKQDVLRQNSSLNAQRKAMLNTKG